MSDNMFESVRKNIVGRPLTSEQFAAHLTLAVIDNNIAFSCKRVDMASNPKVPAELDPAQRVDAITFGREVLHGGKFVDFFLEVDHKAGVRTHDDYSFENTTTSLSNMIRLSQRGS